MRGGEHNVARAYVLYREKRNQERAHAPETAASAAPGINVMDNGVTRPLDMNALRALIVSSCDGLGDAVNADPIVAETVKNLYDGVPMTQVYDSAILAARTTFCVSCSTSSRTRAEAAPWPPFTARKAFVIAIATFEGSNDTTLPLRRITLWSANCCALVWPSCGWPPSACAAGAPSYRVETLSVVCMCKAPEVLERCEESSRIKTDAALVVPP